MAHFILTGNFLTPDKAEISPNSSSSSSVSSSLLINFLKRSTVFWRSVELILFIFSGCGKIVLMKGPDGDIRECKGEYGFGGQIGAIMAANACVEEYEKAIVTLDNWFAKNWII